MAIQQLWCHIFAISLFPVLCCMHTLSSHRQILWAEYGGRLFSLSSERSKVVVALFPQQQLALTSKARPKARTSYMEMCIPTDASALQAQSPPALECHRHLDICCLASHQDARLHSHVENVDPAASAKSCVDTREQAF
jgi:hypothetical protein